MKMNRMARWRLGIAIFLLMYPIYSDACSCAWAGPFLEVSKDAPLVIHGRIIRHHPGESPSIDVLVLETLKGGILDSGMLVQMGDGMHCRPTLEEFAPESEWILALNGPGAKPGKGWALSHCGAYWLQVMNGNVIGSIDGTQRQVKRMALDEFKRKFLFPRFNTSISGRVNLGERFHRPFGKRYEFILEPKSDGWEILIKEYGRDENLSRLTPPLHFAPNPRDIEGWQLSEYPSECASRTYLSETGPPIPRHFIYSPEVGRTIQGPNANYAPTVQELVDIERFGRGVLTINNFKLEPGGDGCPRIAWMEFSVQLEGGN